MIDMISASSTTAQFLCAVCTSTFTSEEAPANSACFVCRQNHLCHNCVHQSQHRVVATYQCLEPVTVCVECCQEDGIIWIPDATSHECQKCAAPFTCLTRRRHHCRFCGLLLCGRCSALLKDVIVEYPENKVVTCRTCVECFYGENEMDAFNVADDTSCVRSSTVNAGQRDLRRSLAQGRRFQRRQEQRQHQQMQRFASVEGEETSEEGREMDDHLERSVDQLARLPSVS